MSLMQSTVLQRISRGMAATAAVDGVEDVVETLNSEGTVQEKTGFLVDYLLSQRSVFLDFLGKLILLIIVFVIGKRVISFALKLTNKFMKKREVDLAVQNFVMSFAKVIYYLILVFIMAGILGVEATIASVIASAGLAVGLALQGSLSNFAGGVLILTMKPFTVGDYIIVDGVEGTVKSIDIFYTKIFTSDNKMIVVPNGTITNSNIVNTTNASERMMLLEFRVPYDTDIDFVKALVSEQVSSNPKICKNRPVQVLIKKLAPVKIQMQVKAWTKTEDFWDVQAEELEKLKQNLQKNKIDLS